MKHRLFGVLLASAFALPACADDANKPAVVPVKKAPFHLFTFEDENMSLENVTLPAGMSTRYHSQVVPVDGMSGNSAYEDHAAAYTLANSIVYKVTLTSVDMIKFK
jgi:hypothetical protein